MNTEKDLEYLLREGIIQTQADLDDYLKISSTKTTRKGKSTAARTREYGIKIEDLKTQMGGISGLTTSTLGMSLVDNGDGTWSIDYLGGSGAVTYSNVYFVDPVNGNDLTGSVNRFDKPFLSISTAISLASVGTPMPTNAMRALVYVRKGAYATYLTLQNYVDIYCEQGVVFTSGQITAGSINCNFLGYAKFQVSSRMFYMTGAANINFEFDTIDSTGASIEAGSTSSGILNIRGRYIKIGLYSNIGITLRGAAQITLNIDEEISGYHEVINFRYASGRIVIKCPRIKILTGNVFGGNFKATLKFYENYGCRVEVFGDLICEDSTYYGGNSGMITFWSNPNVKLTINGKIYGNGNPGTFLASGSSAECTINGDITSNTEPIYVSSNVTLVVKNSSLSYPAGGVYRLAYIEGTAKVFFVNCQFNNKTVASPMIEISSLATADLNVHNSVSEGTGVFIYCVNPINVRLLNVVSNQGLSATVTNLITAPQAFFLDPEIKTIYFN